MFRRRRIKAALTASLPYDGPSAFAGLSSRALRALARNVQELAFRPGEVVFREGDQDAALFMLVAGDVRIEVEVHGGPLEMGKFSGTALLGLASLYGAPREHNIRAISDTRVLKLDRAGSETAATRFPEIRAGFENALEECQRVRPIRR